MVSNAFGSATSQEATLGLISPPTIVQGPSNTTVVQGATVVLTVQVQGTPPFNFRWFRNQTDGQNSSTNTLVLTNIQAGQAGNYTVLLSNAAGTAQSEPAYVTVLAAPVIFKPPQDTNVLCGDDVVFSVEAGGVLPLFYQWYFNGVSLTNATNETLVLPQAGSAQGGYYWVNVSNAFGSVDSPMAFLTMLCPPGFMYQPMDVFVLPGQSASFFAIATGPGPIHYQWQFEGQNLLGQTGYWLPLSSVQMPQVGGYSVVASNYYGSVTSRVATLGLILPPTITQSPSNTTAVQGTTVVLTVQAQGTPPFSFQWFRNGTELLTTTTDTLVLTDIHGSQAGSYTVIVSNTAGGVGSQPAHLTVLEPPFIVTSPQSANAFCGDDVSFSVDAGGTAPLFYQWYFGDGATGGSLPDATNATLFLSQPSLAQGGVYWVNISNAYGTITSPPANLTMLCPPEIVSQPVDLAVPVGQPAVLSVSALGTPPLSFHWNFNGTPIAGGTSATLTLPNVGVTQEGFYSVTVSNTFGWVNSSNAWLAVTGQPPVIVEQPTNQSAPIGARVVFLVKASGSSPLAFQWFCNYVPISGATNSMLVLSPVATINAGMYRVLVSNGAGSVESQVAILQVYASELPFANDFADRVTVYWPSNHLRGHGSLHGATRQLFEPWHDSKRGYHSVWLSWTAPGSGIVTLSTFGSDVDTLLAVYTGESLTSLAPVVGDDDDDASDGPPNVFGWSRLQFNAVQGTVYQIAIDTADFHHTNIVLECDFQPTSATLPSFVVAPRSVVLKPGDPVCLQFTPTSGASLGINWFFNDLPLTAANNTAFCVSTATDAQVGVYQVELAGDNLSSRSARFEIQFNSLGLSNVMARDKFIEAFDFMQAAPPPGGSNQWLRSSGKRSSLSGGTGSRGYTSTQVFSTYGSTPEPGEPAHCGYGPFHSRWFAYQAPTNGTMHITTAGSAFDTVLAVYIGPGTDFETLTNVACNKNANATSTWSEVTFAATSNTIYYIAVDGTSGSQSGNVTLTIALGAPVTFVTPPLSLVVLPGSNATFSVDVSGMTNFTYRWRRNGTNLFTFANTNNPSSWITLTNVQTTNAGMYDVVVSNAINTATSVVVSLVVTNLKVTGQVALEEYAGPMRNGSGTRTVTFMATDGGGVVLATWDVSLSFAPGTPGVSLATYTITNMPLTTARLSAKTAWSLRKRQAVTFANYAATANYTGSNKLGGGDLDGSNSVALADYYRVAAAWYTVNAAADIDGSGLVDAADYMLLASHWGESGDSP